MINSSGKIEFDEVSGHFEDGEKLIWFGNSIDSRAAKWGFGLLILIPGFFLSNLVFNITLVALNALWIMHPTYSLRVNEVLACLVWFGCFAFSISLFRDFLHKRARYYALTDRRLLKREANSVITVCKREDVCETESGKGRTVLQTAAHPKLRMKVLLRNEV